MKIRPAFKFRIYPNKQQQAKLAVQFGHSRFVYNSGNSKQTSVKQEAPPLGGGSSQRRHYEPIERMI